MSIKLLETVTYAGEKRTAVLSSDANDMVCSKCSLRVVFPGSLQCNQDLGPPISCTFANRSDGLSIIWLEEDDALKARLRGKV